MDVSIIYVNYYTKALILDSIRSVKKYTVNISYEIIIVDNNTEDLSEILDHYNDVKILKLPVNVGFGIANNKGAEIARGKYILFLNPDTVLLNNAIFLLFKALDKHSNYGAVGGNLFDEKMNPMHSYMWVSLSVPYILRTVFLPKKFYSSIKYQFNFSNKHRKVGYSTGADLMIRRHLFEKVNGFSEVIFMYYEDVDLCVRVRNEKFDIVNIPQARIQHLEGRSLKEGSDTEKQRKRLEMNIESQAKFLYNTLGKRKSLMLLQLAIGLFALKSFFYKVANLNNFNYIRDNMNFYLLLKKKYIDYEKSINTRV